MMQGDTIAAISTGMTNAGIGIVRMSGDDAIEIISRIYRSPSGHKDLKKAKSHTIHYGYIYDGDKMIDEVLVMLMKGPNSYTREDVVEINCHGGVVVVKRVLETVIRYGARPAEPGEFTKRAFLNGRIDLSQAEAVIDVINATGEMALESSLSQLKGSVRKKIENIRAGIIGSIAFIEAALDDPEHIQADNFGEELAVRVTDYIKELEKVLKTADNGRLVKEGIRTVILGKPNAGKSSLMNLLLGEDRAIVTDIAGTTRDTLEESLQIGGIPLNIIDTAGIRKTEDIVEKIGVDKAISFSEDADLLIYVVDSSTKMDQNDRKIIEMIRDKKAIVLLNKSDLETVTGKDTVSELVNAPIIEISAKTESGIEQFEETLKKMFFEGQIDYNEEVTITNVRHKALIGQALESLKMVMQSIEDGMPEDFFSIDLMAAYEQLGYIIGESVEEDLIDTIFSDFCMGK